MAEITVTRIEQGFHSWRVHFSERVYLRTFTMPHNNWGVHDREAPDRLAAFKWGMEIIRLNQLREQEDGT